LKIIVCIDKLIRVGGSLLGQLEFPRFFCCHDEGI